MWRWLCVVSTSVVRLRQPRIEKGKQTKTYYIILYIIITRNLLFSKVTRISRFVWKTPQIPYFIILSVWVARFFKSLLGFGPTWTNPNITQFIIGLTKSHYALKNGWVSTLLCWQIGTHVAVDKWYPLPFDSSKPTTLIIIWWFNPTNFHATGCFEWLWESIYHHQLFGLYNPHRWFSPLKEPCTVGSKPLPHAALHIMPTGVIHLHWILSPRRRQEHSCGDKGTFSWKLHGTYHLVI